MSYVIETALVGKTIKTGVICFADGTIIYGQGFGVQKSIIGEICFAKKQSFRFQLSAQNETF